MQDVYHQQYIYMTTEPQPGLKDEKHFPDAASFCPHRYTNPEARCARWRALEGAGVQQGPQELPISWFHIPSVATVSYTASRPQPNLGDYLGPSAAWFLGLLVRLLRSW